MNLPKYCLDTHALAWYFMGRKTLSRIAKKIIDSVFSKKNNCFIPSIVLLEAFHISLKDKEFNFPTFLEKLRLKNIFIVPLDLKILSTSFSLPIQLEIHDRIICATALIHKCSLITKDSTIKKVPKLKTIW